MRQAMSESRVGKESWWCGLLMLDAQQPRRRAVAGVRHQSCHYSSPQCGRRVVLVAQWPAPCWLSFAKLTLYYLEGQALGLHPSPAHAYLLARHNKSTDRLL